MMVEKPLTHHKRKKANMNPEKMKPEMRQLEEQYVETFVVCAGCSPVRIYCRFTVYDHLESKRMSYYPHNQTLVNNVSRGEDDEDPAPVVQSATNTLLPTATIVDRSAAGSPTPEQQPPPMINTIPRTSNAQSRTSRSS